jgi:colanic acid/amylovoran biosynthesis glycosyltransferase
VEANRAQVLHFHFLTNARSYLSLKSRTGLPAVVSAYGYDVSLFPRRWGGLGRHYLAPLFTQVECFLAMSNDMQRDLVALGCPPERIRVHYHGVDTRRFACPDRRYASREGVPVTVLTCGRLMKLKGQDRVVEALALIRHRCPVPFRLVVAGTGPLRSALLRTIERLGMGDLVNLVGHVPFDSAELVDHYRDADVFTLASATVNGQREGIPGVIVEAMAAGLPIVSTRHGSIPSVIEHGREGLLVPELDITALADSLEQLIVDAKYRERLGTAAASRAAGELDIVPATAALERIYESLH